MHTEHSHDCSIPVADLLDHAEAQGLGAIAITDHNVFSGAQEAVELARGRALRVVPGEEVMTTSGEVIGLFLSEEIPRGQSMEDTVTAIRDQGGIVYLPHPFDRLHSIPDSRTLHRLLEDVDVFEVYNARLLLDTYNDEACGSRASTTSSWARAPTPTSSRASARARYGCARSTRPRSSSSRLRSAEVLRRPKSLAYLQGLKWVAQAREKRTKSAAGSRRG